MKESERELNFLGLETWQARLEEDEITAQLAVSISIDEYDTRHGEADLGSYPQMEYDLPVCQCGRQMGKGNSRLWFRSDNIKRSHKHVDPER